MLTGKNFGMKESNDNIDQKDVVIFWVSFADDAKYFS